VRTKLFNALATETETQAKILAKDLSRGKITTFDFAAAATYGIGRLFGVEVG
jgi:hypothetical protein